MRPPASRDLCFPLLLLMMMMPGNMCRITFWHGRRGSCAATQAAIHSGSSLCKSFQFKAQLNLQAGIDNFSYEILIPLWICPPVSICKLTPSLHFSSLLIFMSLCLKIKLSINNQPPTPSPTASTWTRNSIWMWIVMDICAGAFASWFMAFDCQPCNYNKIYPMATITITITITSDNRRRCNAHAVAGDCWQRFDHHNYRTGNRNTHICGNICAEFTSQSPARQQGDSSRCGHPAGGCLQGERSHTVDAVPIRLS